MVDRCVYCGKENKIYKLGYCKSCYDLMLTDKYILNPDNDFKDKNIKNMVEYFLKNPTIKKKTLAKKFNISIQKVYYYLKKHTICIKVEI